MNDGKTVGSKKKVIWVFGWVFRKKRYRIFSSSVSHLAKEKKFGALDSCLCLQFSKLEQRA
jgi:hypothetical protein